MDHEADVGAGELKVEGFFLFLLEGRLTVVVGDHVAQFAVVGPASQFNEHLNEFGDFVLVEEHVQFFGADGDVELDGEGLRVGAVDGALPAFLVECQVAGWVAWALASDSADPVSHLAHLFCCF